MSRAFPASSKAARRVVLETFNKLESAGSEPRSAPTGVASISSSKLLKARLKTDLFRTDSTRLYKTEWSAWQKKCLYDKKQIDN